MKEKIFYKLPELTEKVNYSLLIIACISYSAISAIKNRESIQNNVDLTIEGLLMHIAGI